jgi:nucleoside-diphosphate-sugar epimerase
LSHADGGGWVGSVQCNHTEPLLPQERIMKIRKNLEAVFLVAAIVAVPASYAADKVQVLHAAKTAHVAPAAVDANMQVVVVTGHRLSAAGKAALN